MMRNRCHDICLRRLVIWLWNVDCWDSTVSNQKTVLHQFLSFECTHLLMTVIDLQFSVFRYWSSFRTVYRNCSSIQKIENEKSIPCVWYDNFLSEIKIKWVWYIIRSLPVVLEYFLYFYRIFCLLFVNLIYILLLCDRSSVGTKK